jgi:hypothetical protein
MKLIKYCIFIMRFTLLVAAYCGGALGLENAPLIDWLRFLFPAGLLEILKPNPSVRVPGVHLACNKNEYQGVGLEVK